MSFTVTDSSYGNGYISVSLEARAERHELMSGRYPHPHHSRLLYRNASSSKSTPSKLRPIARLPSRAFPPPSPSRSPSASSIAGLSGSSTPVPHREKGKGIAVPLERRELPEEVGHGVRHDGVDWKMMLRLGTNWCAGLMEAQVIQAYQQGKRQRVNAIHNTPSTFPVAFGRNPPLG